MIIAAVNAEIILVLLTFVIMASFGIYASRYKKVPPNTAMIVYGRKQVGTGKGFRVITGGAKFIVPIVESYELLPLKIRTLNLDLNDVVIDVENQRSKIRMKVMTQVKISSDPRILDVAAEHLLHKTDKEINYIACKTIEGHIRGICAILSFEDIQIDRDAVAGKVMEYADRDLKNMGLEMRALIIKDMQAVDTAQTHLLSDEILEKRVRTILEKLLREKGINPVK
jgi:flotillin